MMQKGWIAFLVSGVLVATGCPKVENPVALHTDARLKALTVTADGVAATMSPEFSSDVHVYSVTLPASTRTVSLTLATSDDVARDVTVTEIGARTQATGGVANDTSVPLELPAKGETSTVRIVVTAQDGVTVGGYTVRLAHVAPAVTAMKVSQGATAVAPGSTVSVTGAPIGLPAETTFTIGNAGSADLALGPVTVSGPDFSISKAPDAAVAAGGTSTFNVRFNATAVGTKTALVTIANSTGKDFAFTVSAVATAAVPFVYFVKQTNGTTTASMTGGTITVSSKYGSSGNAFKYVDPNYYGTNSNGFISFPTAMTGDFSMSAEVTITAQNKANNACGIGLGITTGFNPTDVYAYVLMRNQSNLANGYYVSGAGTLTASSSISVPFTNGTALQLSFSRTGSNLAYGAGPVGGAMMSNSSLADNFTDGTTKYGGGAVYPALSFNNVDATITKLVVKDASGNTVYDSATGVLATYIPASLALSMKATAVTKGASTSVTATAGAIGGAVSPVTAVAADSTIVEVSVMNGVTSSTIGLKGLKGGFTTVTVTNTADTNASTSSAQLAVAVNDYSITDSYGSLATAAYPTPGATKAYTDGEMALTFDGVPALNPGGSIKIYKLSNGTEVDSIGFSGETQTLGATVLNVGDQLARVAGNTVYFTPHVGKLAYGTAYYVVIPTVSITGALNGVPFNGLSNLNTVATWRFTTQAAPTLDPSSITVDGALNSTADFRTLQGALNAVASGFATTANVTIHVAAGTYRELLRYIGPGVAVAQTVRIVGPAGNVKGDTCVFQYTNGNSMNGSTATRAVFYVKDASLILENVTLRNTGVRSAVAQAETISFASGSGFTMAAYNSSFYSNQDTIQTSGRTWFYKCFIEGNVDFLWGTAQASLFEDCDLHVSNDKGAAVAYSLIVARTGSTIAAGGNGVVGKGYVLYGSRVKVDDNVALSYGRNAGGTGFYDQVALVDVAFSTTTTSGTGTLGAGLWDVKTPPVILGDPSYIGWKAAGCTGLNLPIATALNTSATIANQSTEYDTRDQILNRVITVSNGQPTGFEAASQSWSVSALATAWGAP